MLKRIRRTTLARSFTGDFSSLMRSRNRSRSPPNVKDSNTASTSTADSSSDETDYAPHHTIRWTRSRGPKTTTPAKTPKRAKKNNRRSSKKGEEKSTEATTTATPDATTTTTPEQDRRNTKMRELPSTAAFSSNHILVNRERIHRGKEPLVRCRHLDGIAKKHAQEMADAQELMAITPIHSAHMAENVQRGPSIKIIHQMIMIGVSDTERDNILSDRFRRFGMGTATGDDGMIYMSQVFQASAAKRRPTF